MAIDLKGRIPFVTSPISPRLVWIGGTAVVVAILSVIYGFHVRSARKRAQTEHQQLQSVSTESATSNRGQVERETPSTGSAPIIPALPPSPLPNGVPTPPGIPGTPGGQPGSLPPTGYAGPYPPVPGAYPPQYQPASYPSGTPVETARSRQEQARSRREEREEQAMQAPTGATEQSRSTITSSDPTTSPLPQLDSLLRQNAAAVGSASAPSTSLFPNSGETQDGYRAQNAQGEKRKFAEGEPTGDDYLKTTRSVPISRWVVQRGTVIPASLPAAAVSDLPGDLVAEVVRDVFDSPTQTYVEIPAGSRLVGEYNSNISYAQKRVQIVWTAIYFPDGTFIDLDRMPSHDADGSTGLTGKVDNHYKRLIAGVALTSLLSAGLQISQNRTNGSVLSYPSTGQVIASGVGTQASQLGEQLTQRNLNIQPTLNIPPGKIFAVSVKKDMVFPGPYEPMRVAK